MPNLLASLGRQTITIGSGDDVDIQVTGHGLPALAATMIHQGHGHLAFVPEVSGLCSVDGRPLAAGAAATFDFQSPFSIGSYELPLTHPTLLLMVMSRGHEKKQADELTIGRDPERSHLVLSSPGVSGCHATLRISDLTIVDHGSTSGTWKNGKRLPTGSPIAVHENDILAIGPLPLSIALAKQLHAALQVTRVASPSLARTESMNQSATEAPIPVFEPTNHPKHRTVMGTIKMVATAEYSIGRTPDNTIVLDFPQLSSHHAKLLSISGQLFLEDSGSELGTYVRGSRLHKGQRAKVDDGDPIHFGAVATILSVHGETVDLVVEDREGWAGRPLFEVEASGITVVVPDRDAPGKDKVLLEDISFKALPGDLIALMGPSGSGKTTLLHALTGYIKPSSGEVRINGLPLPEIFDALRGSIGYVPQDDIIHPELTVREAVRYSARFRLPPDYSAEEIESRVEETLTQLGLEAVAHLQIGRPEQKILSGGQRKRVNIAMELVTDPVLLFLDEPTSGLAADDTTALIELLSRLSARTGKTIVATIHQPAKDEYQKFNLALILGHGGFRLFFGPTKDAYSFFESWRPKTERQGLDTPRDMFAELAERNARFKQAFPNKTNAEVRVEVSRAFQADYENSSWSAAMSSGSRAVGGASDLARALEKRERPRGQLGLLMSRYLKIKLRDRIGMAIVLLQAPLIGVLLAGVFGLQKPAVPYWCLGALSEISRRTGNSDGAFDGLVGGLSVATDNAGALFFLIVSAVWFGTSNAAREIVGERAIFRRERMVNLRVESYVLSKFLVLSVLSMIQSAVLLTIVFLTLGLAGGTSAFFSVLGIVMLTAVCSVALGLALSAVVASAEAAMALTPIALIPQVVLGGLMVPVTTNPWLSVPMKLMPARWGFEGIIRTERAVISGDPSWTIPLKSAAESIPDYIHHGAFHCAEAQMQSSQLAGAWGFGSPALGGALPAVSLTAMTAALLVLVVLILKKRV